MNQTVLAGDSLEVLKTLQVESVNCCVTSPPYWGLRDYGISGQIGLEGTPEEYVAKLVELFREVHRVLRSDGTLWLNLGDSYAGGGRAGKDGFQKWGGIEQSDERKYGPPQAIPNGLKAKDMVGIPWRVAFALQADGWWLRSDIIWAKKNCMPESCTDRPTKSHEYVFLFAKSEHYFYDHEAIKEKAAPPYIKGPRFATKSGNVYESDGTRNKRDVWFIASQPYSEAHFATYPEELVEPCILAGCPKDGVVLDPFCGSGTTLAVAKKLSRKGIGIELNPEYVKLAEKRIACSEELDSLGLFR